MNEGIILSVVNYIIKGHTIDDAVKRYGFSKNKIKKCIDLIRKEDSIYYNKDLAETLNNTLKHNRYLGNIKGGKACTSRVLSETDVEKYALEIIRYDLTLNDIAIKYNIKASTLYKRLLKIKNKELLLSLKRYYEIKRGVSQEWKR